MSDKWRDRSNPDEDIFNDDEYEVKPPSHPHRDGETSGSSSRRHSTDEVKHKHHHKSHKKDKRKKSKSPSHKRKRSRSRSREKDRSYDKREKHSRERPFRSHDERRHNSRRPDRYNACPLSRYQDRSKTDDRNIPEPNLNPQPQQETSKNVLSEATRLKEEIERRKLLWSKKDKPAQSTVPPVWKATAFSDDSDGKVSAKFKRLMGMKGGDTASDDSGSKTSSQESDASKQNQEYLANLEKQYEVARATTHTQRGLGLGFSSGRLWPR